MQGGPSSSCPLSGSFSVNIKESDFSLAVKPDILSPTGSTSSSCLVPYTLDMGCTNQGMVFRACQGHMQETSNHTCITKWKEGEEQFFITRTANKAHFVCYSYREVGDMLVVVMMGQQCRVGEVGSFSFNLTKISDCSDINSSDSIYLSPITVILMMFLIVR